MNTVNWDINGNLFATSLPQLRQYDSVVKQ